MRRRTVIAVALVFAATASTAWAHRAPAVRENNRYVKLTATGNRVRLLYTFYVGEIPGAQARQRMDADGDGVIDPEEADAYGAQIAKAVAAGLTVRVDGTDRPVAWSSIGGGVGTPIVDAGAFAVDMVTWLCLDDPAHRRTHELSIFDRWKAPLPGETEIRVEESPGVRVARATLGQGDTPSQLQFKWFGDTGPLATEGLFVELAVDPEMATTEPDPACSPDDNARRPDDGSRRGRSIGVLVGAAAVVTALGLWMARRARRQRKMNG